MIQKRLKGYKPLLVNGEGTVWVSKGYTIYKSEDNCSSFQNVASYSTSIIKRIKSSIRLSSRLLRTGFHSLLSLSDGSLLGVIQGQIVRCKAGENVFLSVFKFTRGTRPLNICQFPNGHLFFGEYFSNKEREEVYIYGSFDLGLTWQVVYTFPAGEIRHVHGIYYDEYRKGAWILTGDTNTESKIIFTADEFNSLDVVLEGSQQYRAVSIIPLKNGLIIPMDTPTEENYIQWFNIITGKIDKTFLLPGSAFYTAKVGNSFLVSTVVEPSSVNKNNYAAIFKSEDGKNWTEIYRCEKDFWHMKYFQYGSLILPSGTNNKNIIYAYGQAVREVDGTLLMWG